MFTVFVAHGVATAQTITFTKIADTETPVPGGTGTFEAFGNPSLSDGEVAFNGFSQAGTSSGVYIDVGGDLLKVIESGEELDGKAVVLVTMGSEALSGDRLAFRASFGPSDGEGIYVATVPEPSREALTLAAVGIVMLLARWARGSSDFIVEREDLLSHASVVELDHFSELLNAVAIGFHVTSFLVCPDEVDNPLRRASRPSFRRWKCV